MPSFNIVKTSDIEKTFRVQRIMGDFDLQIEHSNEHFAGNIDIPDEWNIGVIVGGSGTGKTTIAREIFGLAEFESPIYSHSSVIDDMPNDSSIDDIEKAFYAVGFGSVPNWIKPYSVLSNGEKMRVDLARMMLEKDFIVFDEFTSVVDRQVATTACIAINKAIKSSKKKFVAVSCHYDILEWLQPDWVFDTNEMKMSFPIARDHKKSSELRNAGLINGKSLGDIII